MLAGAACTAKASLSSTESFWGALDCLSAAYPGLCADSSARGCQPGEAGCIQPLHLGRQPCRGGKAVVSCRGLINMLATCTVLSVSGEV